MSSRLALSLFVLVMALALPVHADPPALPAGFTDCGQESLTERVLVCQGRAYLRAGRADIALAKGRLSLSQHPTRDAHNLTGDALQQLDRCPEACTHYAAVLRVASDDAIAGAGLAACAQGPPPRVSSVSIGALLEGTALAEESPNEGHEKGTKADEDARAKSPPAPPQVQVVQAAVLVALLCILALILVAIRWWRGHRGQRHANLLWWVVTGALGLAGCVGPCGALWCPDALPEPRPGPPVAKRVSPGVWDLTWIYPGAHAHLTEALAVQQGPRAAKKYGCPLFKSALQGAEQHEEKSEGAMVHVHGSGEDPDKKVAPPPTITEVTVRLTCLPAPVPVAGITLLAREPHLAVDDTVDGTGAPR